MKRPLMMLAGCGVWMLAATLFPLAATAEPAADADKSRAVNHRNEQYDANKDGKLDEAEIAAMKADRAAKRKARLLAKYDANKNGTLDPDEEAVHQADLEKRRQLRAERKKAKEAEKAAASDMPAAPADDDADEHEEAKP
ncbi:MAG TPA: hypothetical protein VK178_08015 [Opitutaceae bacterium]|nr:hypothetical protein [Opitutaceae bacterium]